MAIAGIGGEGGPTLSYLAGFFDGEGCILLHKVKKGVNKKGYQIEMFVCQKDPEVLKRIFEAFGGNFKPPRVWWSSGTAARLLTRLYPLLIVKKDVAKLALCFYYLKRSRVNENANLLEEDRELRRKIKERISMLNRRN